MGETVEPPVDTSGTYCCQGCSSDHEMSQALGKGGRAKVKPISASENKLPDLPL